MTLNEYFSELDRKLSVLSAMDWAREPVQDAHSEHAKQIFIKGEDVKGAKEKYKDGSYKKYREKRGRQTAFVDLILEGDLFRDFSTTVAKIGKLWVTGVKRPINSDKIGGMEKLYGSEKFVMQDKTKLKFVEDVRKKIIQVLR